MNKDFLEKTLRSLIEEAQTPGTQLVQLDNSSVKVATGKAREFDNLAALYYGEVERPLTDDDYGKIDYAAYVFDLLKNKPIKRTATKSKENPPLTKEEVPINEEIQNIIRTNSRNIKKITNLQKSYNIINTRYEALTYQKNRLAQMQLFNEVSWQFNVQDIADDLKQFGESRNYLIADIAKNANEINQKLADIISKQMQAIEENQESNFLAKNGKIVPSTLIDEYEALYELLKLCNETITTGNVSIVSGIICVPSSEIQRVEELFMKTNLFAHQEMKKANDLVISEIKKEQLRLVRRRRGESKPSRSIQNGEKTYRILEEDFEEYKNLLAIIEILDKANNSKGQKVKVGSMYVLDSDADTLISLMGSTKFYKDLKLNKEVLAPKQEEQPKPKPKAAKPRTRVKKTPTKKTLEKETPPASKEIAVVDKNADAVKQLERQIDNLATGISTYKGTTSLPIATTKPVISINNGTIQEKDAKVWVVPKGCLPLCNYLVEAINILNRAQGNKLEPIGRFGYVLPEDKNRFQALVRATNGLSGIFPEIPENAKKQAEILRQVAGLIAVAKQTEKTNPNVKINPNTKVLESDMPIYNRLKELYQMLENARFSTELVPVNGVLVAINESDKYLQLDNKANIVIEEKTINPDLNVDEITNLMNLCQTLVEVANSYPDSEVTYISEYRVLKSDAKLFNLLALCGVCLVDATESNNLVPVGKNLYVDAEDEIKYANARKALGSPLYEARLKEIQNIKDENTQAATLNISKSPNAAQTQYKTAGTSLAVSPKEPVKAPTEKVEIKESVLQQYLNQMQKEGKVPYNLKDLIVNNRLSQDITNYILLQLNLQKQTNPQISTLIKEVQDLLAASNHKQNSTVVSDLTSSVIEDSNYKGKHLSNEEVVAISQNGKREQKNIEMNTQEKPKRFSGEEIPNSSIYGKREQRILELGPHIPKPEKTITKREPALKQEPPRVIQLNGTVLEPVVEQPAVSNQTPAPELAPLIKEEQPQIKLNLQENPAPIAAEPKIEETPIVKKEEDELAQDVSPIDKSNSAKIAELEQEIANLSKDIKETDHFTSASDYKDSSQKVIIANRNMSTYLLLKEQIKLLKNAAANNSVEYKDVYLNEKDIPRYQAIVVALEEERQEKRKAEDNLEKEKQQVKTRKPKYIETINWWKENISNVAQNFAAKVVNYAYGVIDDLDAELYLSSEKYQEYSDADKETRNKEFKDYKLGNIMTKIREHLETAQKNFKQQEKPTENSSATEVATETKAITSVSSSTPNIENTSIVPEAAAEKSPLEGDSLMNLIKQHTNSDGTLDQAAIEQALRGVIKSDIFEQNPIAQAQKARKEELLSKRAELGLRIQSPDISEKEIIQIHASLSQIDAELKELTETGKLGIIQERTRKV